MSCQPSLSPTEMRVYVPGTEENLSVSAAFAMTCLTPPRSMRSTRSFGPTAVVVGMMMAPSFIVASMMSHNSSWLPSMTMTGSPRVTPCSASHAPTASERRAISSNVTSCEEPSSSTMTSAFASLPRATTSNQSCAQLKRSPRSGHVNEATASSCLPRRASSSSRAWR